MDLGIAGKRAVVSAGTAGLGLGTARALRDAGCHVAVCSRTQDRVDAAVADLGDAAVGMVADLSSVEGAEKWVADATEALGGIDIMVLNNGGPPLGNFKSIEGIEPYRAALELNLLTGVSMCQQVVPAMQAQGWGRVLAITSVSVRQPMEHIILSNTARTGLTSFLKTVAREVARDGVTVNTIQPGSHLTDRLRAMGEEALEKNMATNTSGIFGDPDDFGKAAAFLCSDPAKFINGASLNLDGGDYSALQ